MKFSFEEPHIWMQHALCLVTIGQYARALSVLKEVTRLLPTKVIPCLLAARICYEHLNQVTLCTGSLCFLLVICQIMRRLCLDYCYGILSNKKTFPVTGHGGLLGCEMLRIPHCVDRWQQGCQPYTPASLYSPETLFFCFWYSFLLEAE
jgi:hypothetical protein